MNKAAAVLISILFAVGTAGILYAADAGGPQASKSHQRERANVALVGITAPTGPLRGHVLAIDGDNDEVKDLTGQEVRFQHIERTLLETHPVLAITSASAGSPGTISARSISPVLRLKRNSLEE